MIHFDPPGEARVLDDSGRMSQPWLEHLQNISDGGVFVGDYRQSWNDDLGTGWVLCDGRSVSTASYPKLYALISTRYASAPGMFGVPNIPAVRSAGAGPDDRPALYTFIRAV